MIKFFTIDELCHSDTAIKRGIDNTPTAEVRDNLVGLIENVLDPLREWYGKPIMVNSGYRCPELNAAIGGAKTSFHQTGCAADIDTRDRSENERLFNYIKENLPFTEMGWEHGGEWVHVAYVKDRIDKEIFSA